MKYLKTLNAVQEKLDRLGDLPVFSATVNRISQISSSKKSDAMALAMAVMKDTNLSARLLRLANSSHCNRGHGRISVVSRAVVLLGFDQIKSLAVTLKLIENFKHSNPSAEIGDLLMRSFLTASITRSIAEKSHCTDVEETYICGLLYSLGEILVAYTLPERYQKMHQMRKQKGSSWEHIQLEALGSHFSDLGQDIAQSWGFPPSVVHSMDLMSAEDQPGNVLGNYQLASIADLLLKLIYEQADDPHQCFSSLIHRLEQQSGLSAATLTECLNDCFKMACDMAEEYHLSTETLMPALRDSGDEALDEYSRKIGYYIQSRIENRPPESQPASRPAPLTRSAESNHAEQLLKQLQLIGDMVDNQRPIQKIIGQVLNAIETSTGFERAGFSLLSKDGRQLIMRVAKGRAADSLKHYFNLNRGQADHQFFFKVMDKGMTLLVTDTREAQWGERLPPSFNQTLMPRGFVLAPIGVGRKTIGFIYADRLDGEQVVNDEDFSRFNQFFMLTKMALAYSKQTQTNA